MKLKPLTNHVVIEPAKPEEKTKSGIVLPSAGDETPEQGVVIAIGSDEKIEVKVGDKVIFSKYGPTKTSRNGCGKYIARISICRIR